ncbi:MAG: exosortase B [Methylotenera sp.]|jgi:exosortase B|uniref:exosortase B n=1 Tax=Methylotenera sp. TaxID=2051956 RepID=UPI00271B7677|nr:exosortase B [Methylotenera sp.]MDO9149913.1 exosortase B [Methylotenera sp.]
MISTLLKQRNALSANLSEWWPILLGLIALYIPTYYALSKSLWNNDDQAHGPIVLMVVLFLFWQNRESLKHNLNAETKPILGSLSLGFGLLCYMLGRSQDIFMLDIGSQIPVLAGILLLTRGMHVLKAMWFPLFFILFMIPLPGVIIDAVTLPMKMAVSYVAENVLFWVGYPIARAGVILHIGRYQLLVADACAGMHTLISLEALGLLYLNLVKHDSLFRNITLALLIIPISFTANVIRVIVLTLVTYHFGDEAGQGFIHGFAGMVLFMVALILIMSVDSILQYVSSYWQGRNVNSYRGVLNK